MTTILVVDDNPLDLRLVGHCVEAAGWQAEYAESGHAVLERLQQSKIDLVATDLQMPGMDGLQLVEQMKSRFPTVPTVLITAQGSEELAIRALHAGASSYLPKRNLSRDFRSTVELVLEAAESLRERRQLFDLMTATQSKFTLGYDHAAARALVNYCQDALQMMNMCDATGVLRVGMALHEGLQNAIDHGNLELDSNLRETDDGTYEALREQRCRKSPFCDRRVHVEANVSPTTTNYVIRDEGPGFDPSILADPTDAENMLKPSGRGIMLMRTFMDDVSFNNQGNELTLVKHWSNET